MDDRQMYKLCLIISFFVAIFLGIFYSIADYYIKIIPIHIIIITRMYTIVLYCIIFYIYSYVNYRKNVEINKKIERLKLKYYSFETDLPFVYKSYVDVSDVLLELKEDD